jgi:hypothetical protein
VRNDLGSSGIIQIYYAKLFLQLRAFKYAPEEKNAFSGVKKTLNTDDLTLEFFSTGCILHQERELFTSGAHKKLPRKWYCLRPPNNLKLHSVIILCTI